MGNLSKVNIALQLQEVLVHQDVPQLFTAIDKVGTRYLCLLVSDREEGPEYAGMPVSAARLGQLFTGNTDLRAAMENSEIGFWYLITHFENETAYAARMELDSLPDEWLPEEGFYLKKTE